MLPEPELLPESSTTVVDGCCTITCVVTTETGAAGLVVGMGAAGTTLVVLIDVAEATVVAAPRAPDVPARTVVEVVGAPDDGVEADATVAGTVDSTVITVTSRVESMVKLPTGSSAAPPMSPRFSAIASPATPTASAVPPTTANRPKRGRSPSPERMPTSGSFDSRSMGFLVRAPWVEHQPTNTNEPGVHVHNLRTRFTQGNRRGVTVW